MIRAGIDLCIRVVETSSFDIARRLLRRRPGQLDSLAPLDSAPAVNTDQTRAIISGTRIVVQKRNQHKLTLVRRPRRGENRISEPERFLLGLEPRHRACSVGVRSVGQRLPARLGGRVVSQLVQIRVRPLRHAVYAEDTGRAALWCVFRQMFARADRVRGRFGPDESELGRWCGAGFGV